MWDFSDSHVFISLEPIGILCAQACSWDKPALECVCGLVKARGAWAGCDRRPILLSPHIDRA